MDKLLTGRRLLVVGNDPMATMRLEDMLDDLGCERVSTAAAVSGALARLRSNSFDAAILDADLPAEASQIIAAELDGQGVPFLVSTSRTGDDAAFARRRQILRQPVAARALARALETLFTPGS